MSKNNQKKDHAVVLENLSLEVKRIGEPEHQSPLSDIKNLELKKTYYVRDNKDRIRFDSTVNTKEESDVKSFERAGPRSKIFFDPLKTRVAIVTCGGICPGLNNVIRSIVLELGHWYKVKKILGIRYGFGGFAPDSKFPPIVLTAEGVEGIHLRGGTVLGSSRGGPPTDVMVKTLVDNGINIVFCIGGDGTLRGAHALALEVEKQNLQVSVIGIPKTIDNDIPFVERSFGFQTAVELASGVLGCAHVEAQCALNGIGLVKLMGRDAGFITSYATRANGNVDYCLIPEMKFPLKEKNGLYDEIKKTLEFNGHVLIAVAEGAGQHLIGDSGQKDASGNKIFNDIGRFLRADMQEHFSREWDIDLNIKYISPSYVIRSVKANSEDSVFCADLARYAVDAAIAGKTDMMVGYWHGEFTNVPLEIMGDLKKREERDSRSWLSVLASTGQPPGWW